MAAELLVVANRDCPHCLQALDLMTDWAEELGVPIAGADAHAHPELETSWALETSPVLIVRGPDGELAVPGLPTHEEFVVLCGRDS